MVAEAPSDLKQIPYVLDLFTYHRRKTRVVMVGPVGVGGNNPIRLQSMTTTPTTDVEATVAQSIRMIEAGCEIVRITAPKMADARALGEIRKQLNTKGFTQIPLVADIHFNPDCAMEAANHVEKVRVNPGNYADSKIFKVKEYTDVEYQAELDRLEERFTPLVLKCKSLGRSMRIGCNHGSLSDRIMNRYGDSPEGMVESALEFVRICQKNSFYDIILSMKSSNPKVMIAAYRLLVARMAQENMDYPLHLGVTEAGYGEDGRIKSAIGIGSLLNDGIGDTIRVSLTEDPEFEIPVARRLAAPYQPTTNGSVERTVKGEQRKADANGVGIEAEHSSLFAARSSLPLAHVDNFYHYARRPTREVVIGPFKIGGENMVRVVNDFSQWLYSSSSPAVVGGGPRPEGSAGRLSDHGKKVALRLLNLFEQQLAAGKSVVPEILEWPVTDHASLEALSACRRALGGDKSTLAFVGRFNDLEMAKSGLPVVHLATLILPQDAPDRGQQFRDFIRAAKAAHVPILLESGPCHRGWLEPARNLINGISACETEGYQNLVLSFRLPTVQQTIANVRLAVALLRERNSDYPIHLRYPGKAEMETQRLEASVAFGSLFCDGIGDSVQIGPMSNAQSSMPDAQGPTLDVGPWTLDPIKELELVYNLLQGAGVRITKTEFVSCPSCGRTLFDLQSTTERIKQQTGHLKGVKIAIMGCIVNGPGEMADADFGYVGGATGKINLYVGKNCVEKGIPFEDADRRLIELIKAHGKWVDPR